MKIKDVVLFAYDFPHKKTQDFIIRLLVEKYNIKLVIAAPWKKLNLPTKVLRIDLKHFGLVHPRKICERFDIDYIVADHNSHKSIGLLSKEKYDLAIIAGARVLSSSVIAAAKNRILNIHPGLLPEVRGLETLLWSIYLGLPIGISAHFISSKLDSGRLILREKLKLKKDDTLLDISLRLSEVQSDVLVKALRLVESGGLGSLKNLDIEKSRYNGAMPPDLQIVTIKRFPKWLAKYAKN